MEKHVNRMAACVARGLFVVAVTAVMLLPGCGGSSEPAKPSSTTDAAAPPPPTPEEIAKRVIKDLQLDQPLPPKGTRLPASVRASTLSQFDQQKATLSKTPEGQAAMEIVKRQLEDRIQALYGAEMWEYVMLYSDAYAKFDPQVKKFDDMRAKAMIELRKPRVTVQGLPEVNGHKVAMLTVYVPISSETFKERLSVGEEMHGIRFVSVYGDDRGIIYEYLETGERYIALLDSAK